MAYIYSSQFTKYNCPHLIQVCVVFQLLCDLQHLAAMLSGISRGSFLTLFHFDIPLLITQMKTYALYFKFKYKLDIRTHHPFSFLEADQMHAS